MRIDEYIAQLDTQSDKSAEKIIRSLVKKGAAAVPKLLLSAKDASNPRIQKWSLQALGAIADKRAAPILQRALSDSRMTVRLHALRGLARMKYGKASSKIAKLLSDKSGGIRVNALQALVEIGSCSDKAAVVKSLKDPQWYVRQHACICCSTFNVTKAKADLLKLAKKDSRKAVRDAATAALESL